MASDDLLYDNPKPVWELPDEEAMMWLQRMYPEMSRSEYRMLLAVRRGVELTCMYVMTEEEYAEHLKRRDDPNIIWWPRPPKKES